MRVLVVDDEPIIRMDVREMLEGMGHLVVGEAGDGATAVEMARSLRPDVVLMDIKMPGPVDGLQASRVIFEEEICPVVLLSAYSHEQLVDEASSIMGICGYLVKPIKEEDVAVALRLAVAMWLYYKGLKEENARLHRKLEEREWVELAKRVLRDKHGLGEAEAYRLIQRMSMDSRRSMGEVARAIVFASGIEDIALGRP